MRAFRKNYKLDFIDIDDVDEWDEHKVEAKIVENIKRFIMALGADFSYMGNQYRLIVDDKEYFIDLLFFNRRLRCLVAIELKWTEFLPEYVGKMNFYLSALDDLVRLPNENPSIGIILCRGQKQRTVEYALRDTRKPMGVATYRAANLSRTGVDNYRCIELVVTHNPSNQQNDTLFYSSNLLSNPLGGIKNASILREYGSIGIVESIYHKPFFW